MATLLLAGGLGVAIATFRNPAPPGVNPDAGRLSGRDAAAASGPGPDAGAVAGATLSGRVLERGGAGVAGVRVVLSVGEATWRGISDAEGRFTIGGLPVEEVTALVFAADFLPPPRRKVVPGTPLEIELERGATVSGTVVDLAGSPIGGAQIELSVDTGGMRQLVSAAERARRQVFAEGSSAAPPRSRFIPAGELGVLLGQLPFPPSLPAATPAPVAGSSAISSHASFLTAADGSFRISAVPPGQILARAHHPDFADGEGGVTAGQVTLKLARGAELAGRVVDPAGHPIFGAEVVVLELARTRGVTFTGPDGSYRLVHVTGPVTVRAGARGFASTQRPLLAEEGGRLEAQFTLSPGGEVPQFGEAQGSLQLDLRDGQTRGPLRSFKISARGPRGAVVERSGEKGALLLGPLAAGPWTLTVESSGFAAQAFDALVAAGGNTPLHLELTQGATIAGTVYSRHGEPVAGAEIVCGLVRGTSSSTGSFLLSGVPAGQVAVSASHPREGQGQITVPLRNGDEALTLEIRLE